MKSPQQSPNSRLGRSALMFLSTAGIALIAPSTGVAQVVIEAGPGVVQISDQDGKTEPVVAGAKPGTAPLPLETNPPTAVMVTPPTVKAVEIQPDPTSPVKVLVPIERPVMTSPNRVAPPVTASPAVAPVNVDATKRKAELKRELNIADSGTGSTIAIFTEDLFDENSPAVTSVATSQLFLLSEYIGLCDEEGVSITYHYAPALHGEGLAWRRSLGLVEWLKVSGGLAGTKFRIEEPVVATESTPTEVVGDSNTALPRHRVVIVVDYR